MFCVFISLQVPFCPLFYVKKQSFLYKICSMSDLFGNDDDFEIVEGDVITGFQQCNIDEFGIAETLSSHITEVSTPSKASHTKGISDVLKKFSENEGTLMYDGQEVTGTPGDDILIRRSFFTPPFTSYRGFAPENSLETDAVWTITKTVENANGTIFSNEQVFNHKWTEINTI